MAAGMLRAVMRDALQGHSVRLFLNLVECAFTTVLLLTLAQLARNTQTESMTAEVPENPVWIGVAAITRVRRSHSRHRIDTDCPDSRQFGNKSWSCCAGKIPDALCRTLQG
jgi:hypothetical protein